jgi:hypothetical protein
LTNAPPLDSLTTTSIAFPGASQCTDWEEKPLVTAVREMRCVTATPRFTSAGLLRDSACPVRRRRW